MRTIVLCVFGMLAGASALHASQRVDSAERILEEALLLVSPHIRQMPIILSADARAQSSWRSCSRATLRQRAWRPCVAHETVCYPPIG